MPLLKGGPKRWKWTEIILKSAKLIVNVVIFKLCNYIRVFLKSKGEKNRRHYLLTDPRTFWTQEHIEPQRFQPTVRLRSSFPQAGENVHSASLGAMCCQYVESPSH